MDAILPYQQLRSSIDTEIAARTKAHQAAMARLRAARAALKSAKALQRPPPLVMLAHGDSWFDYPLNGNLLALFHTTDVIAQLKSMGEINPVILNISHHGDATTDEMSLPKQERMIQALSDPANWLNEGKPDAILFSGGGNDIVGEQFCISVNYAVAGADGLNAVRFRKVLESVEASYLDLFAFRDRFAPNVPIFALDYDFPIPNGVPAACVGPWLKPSLDFCGWTVSQGTAIARQALSQFKAMLQALASDPANRFTLVDTQGTLAEKDWANELHPFPAGFQKIAAKFTTALRAAFPGRI